MMGDIQEGKKGFYQTSGLMMDVAVSPDKSLIESSLKLYNGTQIEDKKYYSIASVDFLVPTGGDDFKNVISWLKPVDFKIVAGCRNSLVEYVSKVKYIIESMFVNPNHKRLNVVSNSKGVIKN
jgi:hypothetical protein